MAPWVKGRKGTSFRHFEPQHLAEGNLKRKLYSGLRRQHVYTLTYSSFFVLKTKALWRNATILIHRFKFS
ncbi:hypothetical protein HA466_0060010 [Hirschfeldia incana]|nr:hypothetical protein HA466_0060010 [Hirschfeldia incana]